MKKDYIIFDLDGTLTDPMVGITKSVQYALRSYGIEVDDLETLCPFIGPPLKDSFMKYYGFSPEQASEAIGRYREYFTDTGLYENVEYSGIQELLSELKAHGKHLFVATSKPEVFAKQILEYFQLSEYFDFIGGASMDEVRVRKGDVIKYVLYENPLIEPSEAIMVGDREHDVLGAKEAGIESIGVLYGYGDREELELAGADYVAATIEELAELICW